MNFRSQETEFEKRYARLNGVLQKSVFYATRLKERMDEEKAKYASCRANSPANKPKAKGKGKRSRRPSNGGSKRARVDSDEDEEAQVKRIKVDAAGEEGRLAQPALITGARLKGYQLEGVEWMIGLDKNGVSGILGMFAILLLHRYDTHAVTYSGRDGFGQGTLCSLLPRRCSCEYMYRRCKQSPSPHIYVKAIIRDPS